MKVEEDLNETSNYKNRTESRLMPGVSLRVGIYLLEVYRKQVLLLFV